MGSLGIGVVASAKVEGKSVVNVVLSSSKKLGKKGISNGVVRKSDGLSVVKETNLSSLSSASNEIVVLAEDEVVSCTVDPIEGPSTVVGFVVKVVPNEVSVDDPVTKV